MTNFPLRLATFGTLVLSAVYVGPIVTPGDHAGRHATPSPGATASFRQQDAGTSLIAADAAWSARAQSRPSGVALADMLDADALVLSRGREVLRGAQAKRALASDSTAKLRQRWTPVRAEASADGSRGYTFGVYELLTSADSVAHVGKYLAWWRRDGGGAWRVHAYVRVSRPAGAPELGVPRGFDRVRTGTVRTKTSRTAMLAEVRAADRAFSEQGKQGLARAFRDWATPDAAMLGSGNEFIWGPTEIEKSFDGFPPTMTLTWAPTYADGAASGDLAMTIGRGLLADTATPSDAPSERRYLTIWRRMPDGRWRFVNDGGTAGPASAPSR